MEGEEDKRKPSLAKLLKYGIDPNSLSFEDPGERRTLLCLAIEEAVQIDDYSKVTLLLESRADPNRCSETGSFPLQIASKHGDVRLARQLLQAKADVNQQDSRLVSALHTAAHEDEPRLLQLLLLHKANVNAVDQVGQPPVFFASSRDTVSALLEAAADALHLNKRGQSALHLAAHNGAYEAVSYFTEREGLQHLIDLQDERGRTPLHHAAAKGHQGVVSRLMDVGADATVRTSNGQTAMSLADAKDTDVAYYIYTRVTGGNRATWREMAQNPIALTLAAVLGVACFVNRKLLWEFGWDLLGIYTR
mmetsp:Transcript_46373/g.107102  ORF Transcript_46373/g.107102 Transcript_46373/m.107102 type:complete len:306 (+) Transcript_46373:92-1009(+)